MSPEGLGWAREPRRRGRRERRGAWWPAVWGGRQMREGKKVRGW